MPTSPPPALRSNECFGEITSAADVSGERHADAALVVDDPFGLDRGIDIDVGGEDLCSPAGEEHRRRLPLPHPEGNRAIDAKRRGTGSSLTLRWRGQSRANPSLFRCSLNREKYRELPRFPPEQALDCLRRASIFNGLPKQFPKTANREDPTRYQGIGQKVRAVIRERAFITARRSARPAFRGLELG